MAYTKQNARVIRWQSECSYDTSGNISSVNTSVFLVSRVVNDADPTDVRGAHDFLSTSFELLTTTGTITAATKTVSYTQLAALLRQASLDQANLAGIQ